MKRYEKYKPSGIEWIGEIPEHWKVKKLKYVLTEKLKYGANEPAEFEDEKDPRYIRITDFGDDGKLRDDTFKSLPFETAKEYLLKEGDILFARSGATVGKTFQFKKYKGLACFAGYLIKASPDETQILSDFLNYFTKSGEYENWKNSIFNQATIQNIGADKYGLLEILLPLPKEQAVITNYLDEKISEIDAFIAKKKKLIELIKEERTTIINEAVNGEGKNWEKKKLKHVAALRDELIEEADFKIAVENIESGSGKLINMLEDKNYEGQLSAFKRGDTIFNKLRPYLHKVYLAEKDGGLFGELLIIYSRGELVPEFLFYKLFSKSFIDIVDGSTQGTKMPRANWNDFISQLFISFPKSKQEQIALVHDIQTKTIKIENTISKIEAEIELMQEYRTALISEVVTGKFKIN